MTTLPDTFFVFVISSRLSLYTANEAGLTRLDGGREGQLLIVELAPNSSPVVLSPNSPGNIEISRPMRLVGSRDRLVLMRTAERWVELSRTDAGPPAQGKIGNPQEHDRD